MTELNICSECGHLDENGCIKTGDRLWFNGVHYIIATVDFDDNKHKVGIQLIDPDNGTRSSLHPVYVQDHNDITEYELKQLMTV